MHNNYNLLSIKFAPIMPAFCFLPSYYSNNFADKINASLGFPMYMYHWYVSVTGTALYVQTMAKDYN